MAQRDGSPAGELCDNVIVFGRGAVMTTSGSSLDATTELSKGRGLTDSNGESRSVQPPSRATKTTAIPVRTFARRMIHYLFAPCVLYEYGWGAKFCSDTIVHTMLTINMCRCWMRSVCTPQTLLPGWINRSRCFAHAR
jgi:hypothetical protein